MKREFLRNRARGSGVAGTDGELSFSSEEVEAFWSEVATGHYERANKRLHDAHVQRFDISVCRIEIPVDGRLLNVWSRQGEALPYIRARFPNADVENAEISRTMLAQSKERFPLEKFRETDLQSLGYPDDYFDGILSLEMLEHSPSPQRILREMSRVLKPGGQLVLTCPSAVSELHLWIADHFLDNHGEGPHRFPSTRLVKSMLKKAGLALVDHRSTLFVPEELGPVHRLNPLFEWAFQWFPASELGIRQLYEARK